MSGPPLPRIDVQKWSMVAILCVAVMVISGLMVVLIGEQVERRQLVREGGAQADLLASAVRGALAFDDAAAAQDYVDAVQVNGNVLAAAVYDSRNRLVAGFAREGQTLLPTNPTRGSATEIAPGQIRIVRPVVQSGQHLGSVRVRMTQRPLAQRLARYATFGLIIGFAALVFLVLTIAQNALRRVNAELAARANDLARANTDLQAQITERERAEEALRQSQKMEAIGRLTGGVAHDFNNLLMAASSGVELLEKTSDPKRRAMLVDGVRQAIERGATLTTRLLAFSRTTPLQSRTIDLAAQIEGMRVLLEHSVRETVQVELDLAKGLWPVRVDESELEIALLNLAVNASDAMPDGGVLTIRARNTPGEAGDCVTLAVSDTGLGIPPSVIGRVFEPFFTTKGVGKGTGLGLSQIYGFARSSGGAASIRSEEGKGAEITIRLPRAESAPLAVEEEAPAAALKAEGRVLMVEDDDAVARGVGQMLTELGYRAVRASGAAEALEVLREDPRFDIVFSDMVMPGEMNGLGLARELRSTFPDLPIVLTTGYSEMADQVRSEHFPLLLKPYRLTALGETLERARSHPPHA